MRGKVGASLPDGLVPDFIADKKTADATREFGQLMSMEAIKSMSQTLKGATTDRELERFVDILGDPATPPNIRKSTINRMIQLVDRQRGINESRVKDLRGGDYYQPADKKSASKTSPDAVTPKIGDRKTFKQGIGVWNGKTWVPEGSN